MSEIIVTADALRDEPPAPVRQLRGNLGVASIVFMVVAAAAPLGVIGGVVPLGIASGNGAGFPATFIISTVILLFFAVGFTAMTPYVEEAGAFFSYVRKSLGFPTGIGIAFVAIVSYLAIEAGVYGLLGPAGVSIVELFGGPALPWWLFAAVAFAVTTFLGYRNIELSSRVLAVLLTAEIAIVAVLDLVIVVQGGDHGLSNGIVNPSAILSGSLGIGLLFAIISYVGFEATAIFRDEARTPERTIPRATYVALDPDRCVLRGDQLGVDLGMGRRRGGNQGNRFRRNIPRRHGTSLHRRCGRRHHHGAVLHQPVRLHSVVPQRGVALCFRTVAARRPSGKSLSRPHAKHGSPHEASLWISGAVAVSIILAVVFKLDPAAQFYTWFAGATTVGIVVLLLATSVAVLVFFARDRAATRSGGFALPPHSGVVGLLGSLILILANLKDLVGGSSILAWVIVGLLVAAFAVGAVVGTRVRDNTVERS